MKGVPAPAEREPPSFVAPGVSVHPSGALLAAQLLSHEEGPLDQVIELLRTCLLLGEEVVLAQLERTCNRVRTRHLPKTRNSPTSTACAPSDNYDLVTCRGMRTRSSVHLASSTENRTTLRVDVRLIP